MHIWMEIEYVRKDGDNVHSDLCMEEDKAREIYDELFDEVKRLADFKEKWSIHSNGICMYHTEHKEE